MLSDTTRHIAGRLPPGPGSERITSLRSNTMPSKQELFKIAILTRSRCRSTIRSARWRTCWPRHTSVTSRAAFTPGSIRTRSRTSAVGSTARQRADASCRRPQEGKHQDQMTIVIDIVTNGRSGAPASPSTLTGSIRDRRGAAPLPRKAQLERNLIHESHPVSRLRRLCGEQVR